MKRNLLVLYIIAGILVITGIVNYFIKSDEKNYSEKIKVIDTFQLPNSLREISGISHIDDSRIACIQDEEGIIFIYNLEKKKVTGEIKFGPKGDYESVRIIDSAAYVMESNGKLFKINNFESDRPKVEVYKTGFDRKNDIESFDYLKKSDQFLTSPKEKNLGKANDDFVIYSISSKEYKVENQPYSKLSPSDSNLKIEESFFYENKFHASELTIHPDTQEIYLLDSKFPRLLILNSDGSYKNIYNLNPKDFQQPEGISFDSQGKMYISNEESDFLEQNIQLVEWE